jgi:hypothetical protein
LGVAVTVCELPDANVPPPLTLPSALGEALTTIVYRCPLLFFASVSCDEKTRLAKIRTNAPNIPDHRKCEIGKTRDAVILPSHSTQ